MLTAVLILTLLTALVATDPVASGGLPPGNDECADRLVRLVTDV